MFESVHGSAREYLTLDVGGEATTQVVGKATPDTLGRRNWNRRRMLWAQSQSCAPTCIPVLTPFACGGTLRGSGKRQDVEDFTQEGIKSRVVTGNLRPGN